MATIHGCRWEWCRNVFDTHTDLVDHIKSEHLLRMRPVTKKDAAARLRTEGYTPEEIATRLIPGYVATQPTSAPADDPPHQAPESSPLTLEPPLPHPIHEKGIEQQAAHNPSGAVGPPQNQTEVPTLPYTKPLNNNGDRDEDMPPSSPPRASPDPSPGSPSPTRPQVEEMDIDQLEHSSPKPTTDFFVPVSSPPRGPISRASSVGSRTPRLRRRSSFSQLSSSVSPDEFTAPRYAPLPESPSTSTMIAEREKELKAKEVERERERGREKEREQVRHEADRGRGSPVGTSVRSGPEQHTVGVVRAMGSKRARGVKRGLGRGRGEPGLQITTPGRKQPPSTTSRHASPGLRIESRSTRSGSRRLVTPDPNLRGSLLEPRPGLDVEATAEQMINKYTHVGSYNEDDEDDEDMLRNAKERLDNPDWGLQTQVPYVSETQTSYPSQTQA